MKENVEPQQIKNPITINGLKFWFDKIPNTSLPFPTFSKTSQERLVDNRLYDLKPIETTQSSEVQTETTQSSEIPTETTQSSEVPFQSL